MPDDLPPIDQQSWDSYQADRFQKTTGAALTQVAQAGQAQADADAASRDAWYRTTTNALAQVGQAQQAQAAADQTSTDAWAKVTQNALAQTQAAAQVSAQAQAPSVAQNSPDFAPQMPSPVQVAPGATATTVDLSAGSDAGRQYDHAAGLARVYQDALASGLDEEGARAATAVAQTEGGMGGALGDVGVNGSQGSAGTFQLFFGGGQGNNYAQQHGLTTSQAIQQLRADPHAANTWALQPGGYLGDAIRAGQALGLHGADLATYAQQHGQVSVSPERAGQNYQALYADGKMPFEAGQIPQAAGGGQVAVAAPAAGQDSQQDAGMTQFADEAPNALAYQRANLPEQADQGDQNQAPDVPGIGAGTLLRTPFGPALSPLSPPIQPPKLGPPDFTAAETTAETGAPIRSGEDIVGSGARKAVDALSQPLDTSSAGAFLGSLARVLAPLAGGLFDTGKAGGFVGNQGSTLPGIAGEVVSPESTAEEAARVGEARGGVGGDLGGLVRAAGEMGGGGGDVLEGVPSSVRPAAAPGGGANAPEDEIARLRLDKFPEPVRDVIQQAATGGDFWQTQRRGVIPDAQAEQMADDLGRSVDQIIAAGKAGKAYTTEETRAIRNAYVAQAVKVNDLAAQIAQAPHEASPALLAQSVAEGMKLADLSRVAEGARAEAGRTLRAYQAFARDYAADPASAVQRIVKAVGGDDAARQAVTEYNTMVQQGAGPAQLANFWARVEKPPPGAADWFRLLRYNSMLSGPRTFEVNAVGNAVEIPLRLVRDVAASALSRDLRPLGPEIGGIWSGAARGADAFMQTLAHGITDEAAVKGEIPAAMSARLANPAAKGIALGLELPGRLMGAADEFATQTAFGMVKGRMAGVQASREGLSGPAWTARMRALLDDPAFGVNQGALDAADRMVFHGEMGNLGTALGKVSQVPIVGNILIPFLRTVYHITSRGIDLSPIGALGTAADVARGVYGDVNPLTRAGRANLADQLSGVANVGKANVPLGERLGNNVLGSLATLGMFNLASAGYISASGPEDRQKRDMLTAQGWQPYSVKIGDKWVSYSNWGPLAVPLSLAAGAAEAVQYRKPKDTDLQVAADTFSRGARVLTDQAYLQGIGAVYKGITEPDRYGTQWLQDFVSSLVPYGAAINTVGQATDPYVAQPERGNVGQALESRFPGLREQLPAREDILGRPVENQQRGAAAFVPLRVSTDRPNETLQLLQRYGVDVPEPPTEVQRIPLTPAEQRRYQFLAGRRIEQLVQTITQRDSFARQRPDQQTAILQAVVQGARDQAQADWMKEIGMPEARRRMLEARRPAGATP